MTISPKAREELRDIVERELGEGACILNDSQLDALAGRFLRLTSMVIKKESIKETEDAEIAVKIARET